MTKKELYKKTIEYFEQYMPNPQTELHYNTPFQLLVAVLLSAQCTDVRVNKITPILFEKYPNAYSMSKATQQEIFELIKSCSYPNNKAKYLVEVAKAITEKYNGNIPENPKEMEKLPGIGRKSANVLASIIYDKPVIAVDTHVFRVANRIGLTKSKTPLQTEKQLSEGFPKKLLPKAHHWLILHGRYICKAQKPLCEKCGLKEICNYYKKQQKKI